jgi:hypothetical protein
MEHDPPAHLHQVTGRSREDCARALEMCDEDMNAASMLLFSDAFAPPAQSEAPPPARVEAQPAPTPAPAPPPPSAAGAASPPDRPVFRFGGGSPTAAPAAAPAPTAADQVSPRPVFKFGGAPAPAPAPAPPAPLPAESASPPAPVFSFGGAGAAESPPATAEASPLAAESPQPRPVFKFGGGTPAGEASAAATPATPAPAPTSPAPAPPPGLFDVGSGSPPVAPAPAPVAAPATPSMPTLRRKLEEKQATKQMLESMGERTSELDFEIAQLMSMIPRDKAAGSAAASPAEPAAAVGAADPVGGDDSQPTLAAAVVRKPPRKAPGVLGRNRDDGGSAGRPSLTPRHAVEEDDPERLFAEIGSLLAGGRDSAPHIGAVPRRTGARERAREPNGLGAALERLMGMGFVESEARAALLATRRRSIGAREIEQATQMLLSGEVPDPGSDSPQDSPSYDASPFGGRHGGRDPERWLEPSSSAEDTFDPSDPVATTERIEMLMALVAASAEYRTEEYLTCYRILMEKESVQWRVPQAADWLFSRAGGEGSPIVPVLDTLPVLFGVRRPDPLEVAAAQDLARAGSGSGRDDIVWEWEKGSTSTLGMRRHMMAGPMGGAAPGIYDENGRPDPDRWGEYPVEAMTLLDLEWEKGEGARGAVLVRSGGSEFLVDLGQMTQSDVEEDRMVAPMGSPPAIRRVRRRRAQAAIGPLGPGETLSVQEDPTLAGDTIIAPQSYIERLDMFKIGRRNRASVFRLSVQGSDDAEGAPPRFLYCRAAEFSGMEGTCAVPTWMARYLQLPEESGLSAEAVYESQLRARYGGGGHGRGGGIAARSGPRVRVEPWLLPTCGGVKLKCITAGFEELVRTGAAEAADGSFDVTSVLSGPLSDDFCTLTAGSIVPIRCGVGRDVFEFIVMQTRRLRHGEEEQQQEQEEAGGGGDGSSSSSDVDVNVEGVDLKSTFNAELALDMSYLTDDVAAICKAVPSLDDGAAREILKDAGYDLRLGLEAAVVAGSVKEVSDRKQQAREVKRLEQLAGVSRGEAERALSENGWSLAAAQAALADGAAGDDEDGDDGATLARGPSTNTLRNRRLERLSGGGAAQLAARQGAHAHPAVSPFVPPARDGQPIVNSAREGPRAGGLAGAENIPLPRVSSLHARRERRLAALHARGAA